MIRGVWYNQICVSNISEQVLQRGLRQMADLQGWFGRGAIIGTRLYVTGIAKASCMSGQASRSVKLPPSTYRGKRSGGVYAGGEHSSAQLLLGVVEG